MNARSEAAPVTDFRVRAQQRAARLISRVPLPNSVMFGLVSFMTCGAVVVAMAAVAALQIR